jgi:hypothetical protein
MASYCTSAPDYVVYLTVWETSAVVWLDFDDNGTSYIHSWMQDCRLDLLSQLTPKYIASVLEYFITTV